MPGPADVPACSCRPAARARGRPSSRLWLGSCTRRRRGMRPLASWALRRPRARGWTRTRTGRLTCARQAGAHTGCARAGWRTAPRRSESKDTAARATTSTRVSFSRLNIPPPSAEGRRGVVRRALLAGAAGREGARYIAPLRFPFHYCSMDSTDSRAFSARRARGKFPPSGAASGPLPRPPLMLCKRASQRVNSLLRGGAPRLRLRTDNPFARRQSFPLWWPAPISPKGERWRFATQRRFQPLSFQPVIGTA